MPKKIALTANWIVFSIITLGLAEILTQLVVVREFLSVFYGNELVIGILLANWLLISGFGSYVGRKAAALAVKERLLVVFHMVVAFLLAAYIYVIRSLYGFAFIRGELVGVTGIFLTAFLILLPICFITGFSLPLFSLLYRGGGRLKRGSGRGDPLQVGRVYFFDSLSNIIGGLLFSFVLICLLDAFQIALLVMVVNLFAAMLLSKRLKREVMSFFSVVLLVLGVSLFVSTDLDLVSTQAQYPGQGVAFMQDSVYGRYVVTRSAEQLNFFQDGVPLFSTGDIVSNEETVHFPMLQHSSPEDVLLISGGASGTTYEALLYDSVESVDYVELDPLLVFVAKKFTDSLDDDRIHVYNNDARLFVRQAASTGERYDVVIIDMPDPATAQANRFYTEEFFGELRDVLDSDGVVGLSLSAGANYMNEETTRLNSAVYNALRMHFSEVLIIPGDRAFYVASDSGLSYDAYDDVPVRTFYVNSDYMSGRLSEERIGYAYSAVSSHDQVNRDFRPVAYYYHLLYWLGHFEADYLVFVALLVGFLAFALWRVSRVGFAVFTAGFAGISLELLLVFGFQVIYGNVYQRIGVIVTSFMVGLAVGAWVMNRRLAGAGGEAAGKAVAGKGAVGKGAVVKILSGLAVLSVVVPSVLLVVGKVVSPALLSVISLTVFPLLTALAGLFVGLLFPVAAKLGFRGAAETAGSLYFYDYAGACIGALLVSVLLVPVLGVFLTSALVAVLCLVAVFINR